MQTQEVGLPLVVYPDKQYYQVPPSDGQVVYMDAPKEISAVETAGEPYDTVKDDVPVVNVKQSGPSVNTWASYNRDVKDRAIVSSLPTLVEDSENSKKLLKYGAVVVLAYLYFFKR